MTTPLELSHPIYTDETAARLHLEALRWPNGVTCPRCGSAEGARPVAGESMGDGWYYCQDCQDKFTVRVGTVYERSHIPLHKWLLAFRLMASSKKGMSAHQLHRTLGITYKSAWFLAHRIREAMTETNPTPMGGEGEIVEIDETFIGNKGEPPIRTRADGKVLRSRTQKNKHTVLTLVERSGRSRSFHVDNYKVQTIKPVIMQNVSIDSRIETDEGGHYMVIGKEFKSGHGTVSHKQGEYVRGDHHTNTVEGFYSIFKRGMKGVYQHCGEQHLQRYLNEFDFRYSHRIALGVDDAERTELAVKGAEGKRLTYRRPHNRQAAH